MAYDPVGRAGFLSVADDRNGVVVRSAGVLGLHQHAARVGDEALGVHAACDGPGLQRGHDGLSVVGGDPGVLLDPVHPRVRDGYHVLRLGVVGPLVVVRPRVDRNLRADVQRVALLAAAGPLALPGRA